mgnify:CR=1 FL=1
MSEQEIENKSSAEKSNGAPKSSTAKKSTASKSKTSSSAAKSTGKSNPRSKSSESDSSAKTAAKKSNSGEKSSAAKSAATKKTASAKSSASNAPKSTRAVKPKTNEVKDADADISVEIASSETDNQTSAAAKQAKPKTARKPRAPKTVVSDAPSETAPDAAAENELSTENIAEAVEQSRKSQPETEIATVADELASVGSAVDESVAASAENNAERVDVENETDGNEPLLRVKDLKKYFLINNAFLKKNRRYLHAVDGVSFDLYAGKTIGIVGESGCGKTTMGRTILRLTDVTSGEILFKGTDLAKLKGEALRKLRPQFQMIFQDPYSSLSPRMPVGEIIGEAVKVHKIVPKEQYKDYIIDIMQKCGLQSHYFERYPHEFSGGQRQRICIAKVLALNPQLVICDEPVSALDVSIQAQIINLFKDLQNTHNLAYVFISHDLSVVEHISDDVGVMYLGNMVELAPKKELFARPMHPYTEALLSAVPMPDPSVKMNRITLNGDIPSPANPPKGCKFHTRCTKCMDVCKEVEPKFKNYGNGHCVACHLYSQDD